MILNSIKLDNIRSYVSENVIFPQGSLMLSGDIGSGKSTILLAAEFALFGLRSDLRGESLLRHGKETGSVELHMNISGKDIIIRRGLKRTNKSVQQDTGYLIIDGVRKDLTAVELKTHIIDVLGYPKELVSKSKQLVYRYTVYTPQEQMKEILFDDKEERLNTLRRVFGIDKYKRVIENTSIITKQLKLRTKELAGSIHDLEQKKASLSENRKELEKAEKEAASLMPYLEKAKNEVADAKESAARYEKEMSQLNELKSRLGASDARLKEKLDYHQRNSRELEQLNAILSDLQKKAKDAPKIEKPDPEKRKQALSRKEQIDKELNQARLKINELEINMKNSQSVIDKISQLSSCPTCLQDVPEEYRNQITTREQERQSRLRQDIEALRKALPEKEEALKELNRTIESFYELEKKYERFHAEAESSSRMLNEKMQRRDELLSIQESIKKEIAEINTEKIDLNKRIAEFADSEKNYLAHRKLLDQAMEKQKQLEMKKLSWEKEAEGIRKITESLQKEIAEKEQARQKITNLKGMQEWLEGKFVSLMTIIEKHIMAKVYEEFNELFQQWFSTMIEDEALSVSLDHDFTPVVQQDGYETSIEHLSGGEKTSVALAYRLSLNKVINDVIGAISTKDIIILDEPTDGFSSEQLDKVREVIEQLEMQQIILVSHEPKIESFVDSILRIEKRGHVSSVMEGA
ncbi:AAA family ATPase [Candidatus Woesearchaeota archaeon]|nr:AAA family ATPase [Candidatus Woesearchaeota archaeon]